MTQEQALIEAQALFPDDAAFIAVAQERVIGCRNRNEFYIWNWRNPNKPKNIVAVSFRSWEHALAIAKSGNAECWPVDDSPIAVEAGEVKEAQDVKA